MNQNVHDRINDLLNEILPREVQDVEYTEEITSDNISQDIVEDNTENRLNDILSELNILEAEITPLNDNITTPDSNVSTNPMDLIRESISSGGVGIVNPFDSDSASAIESLREEIRVNTDVVSELIGEIALSQNSYQSEENEDDYMDKIIKLQNEQKDASFVRESISKSRLENMIDSMSDKTSLTTRFSGLKWAQTVQEYPVTLIGLGGIGSFVNFFLSRIRPAYVYLYDDDIYELANVSGQLVANDIIGETKVVGAQKIAQRLSNYSEYMLCKGLFIKGAILTPITITGLDNMEARKQAYYTWEERYGNNPKAIFIDGRLNVENFQIFALRGGSANSADREDYKENHLFGENEAIGAVCSMKQTSHIASMIGSYITNIYTNFLNNLNTEGFPMYVPYYVEYNANMFNFEVKGGYL